MVEMAADKEVCKFVIRANFSANHNTQYNTFVYIKKTDRAEESTPVQGPGEGGQTSSFELLTCLHTASLTYLPHPPLASTAADQNMPAAKHKTLINSLTYI